MKITRFLIPVFAIALTGCSSMPPAAGRAKADLETVLVVYHAKPGREGELQAALSRAWQIYRTEHLVFAKPHTLVRATDAGDKTRFVEVFTWVKAPDHAPEDVNAIWKQEEALCEPRTGQRGIEFGEVELITGK